MSNLQVAASAEFQEAVTGQDIILNKQPGCTRKKSNLSSHASKENTKNVHREEFTLSSSLAFKAVA